MAIFSVEAKYVALANAIKEATWLYTLLTELDFLSTIATIIYANNQGCITLVNNLVFYSCVKHIDICYYFIWECIEC